MTKLNIELIYNLLEDLRTGIHELENAIKTPYDELSSMEKFGIRYIVISLVESSSSICMHLLHNLFGIYPKGYPSCFILLAEKGIIPKDLGESLARAARLRNILVHKYWEVDDNKVYLSVKKGILDFKRFVELIAEAVKKWSK